MRDCGDREREQQCSSSSSLGKKRRSKIMEQQGEGNIARECTECGKKFWSWKALFGHMRCHPERQWRGINPPPNFRRQQQQHTNTNMMMMMDVTQEDHEVAACLLLLANSNSKASNNKLKGINVAAPMAMEEYYYDHHAASSGEYCPMMMSGSQFECSSCNKVFGSHQALGGHRASHKNVKGCFANNADHVDQQPQHNHFRNLGVEGDHGEVVAAVGVGGGGGGDSSISSSSGGQHKCGICLRVFTTGQALGGHKRCHWDRPPDNNNNNNDDRKSLVDLNLPLPPPPPPPPDHAAVDASSSPLTLDLRLGL